MTRLLVCLLVLLVSLTTSACTEEATQTAEAEGAELAAAMQDEGPCAGVEGAWEYVSGTYVYPDTTIEWDATVLKGLKILTSTHWLFVTQSLETGELSNAGGGRHTTQGGTHTVERDYHTNAQALEAGPTSYDCRIEGDTWYVSGQVGEIGLEEQWQRAR